MNRDFDNSSEDNYNQFQDLISSEDNYNQPQDLMSRIANSKMALIVVGNIVFFVLILVLFSDTDMGLPLALMQISITLFWLLARYYLKLQTIKSQSNNVNDKYFVASNLLKVIIFGSFGFMFLATAPLGQSNEEFGGGLFQILNVLIPVLISIWVALNLIFRKKAFDMISFRSYAANFGKFLLSIITGVVSFIVLMIFGFMSGVYSGS